MLAIINMIFVRDKCEFVFIVFMFIYIGGITIIIIFVQISDGGGGIISTVGGESTLPLPLADLLSDQRIQLH